ncbi:hypothetical protein AAFF_G00369690 [Aldrovandia affinis]|uniref:ribonuclease H n=1 Tax=Aldrovandia affinis TaxID=143900 RepID=A0AAD7R4L7_9TELE|nr:hypothetical protein AAFF_G00369690 [Aldrovandia affinis]
MGIILIWLCEFPGEHHIYTDPKVPPVIHGCRRIPYSVYDRLKDTLDDLQKRGAISRVTKPTAWVSSLCITGKKRRNGSLRVCLDPKDLNRAILHQHFSILTPEDVQGKLVGKTIFTILDEKHGYHQIKSDDESADLCTFNTPWGRYRFHRLPFGIKSASEVFQQTNSEAFGDIEGVSVIADDMIIAAATKTEHDSILQKVMDRAIQLNVKFNKDKIQYMVGEVRYMGYIIDAAGVKPNGSKVAAIQQLAPPTDRKALQRLLGMTRYLAQYLPDESTLTAPLRQLLRKDIDWQWHPEHQMARPIEAACVLIPSHSNCVTSQQHSNSVVLRDIPLASSLGLVLVSVEQPGRGKPPVGTETSGGGDLMPMRASLSLKGRSGEAGRFSSAELFSSAGGAVAALGLRLSLQAAPSWAQEKGGGFKFI